MPETTSNHLEIYVGVDTHKEQHVAVTITSLGTNVDRPRSFAATLKGYQELLAWSSSMGPVPVYGLEDCGSYDAASAASQSPSSTDIANPTALPNSQQLSLSLAHPIFQEAHGLLLKLV